MAHALARILVLLIAYTAYAARIQKRNRLSTEKAKAPQSQAETALVESSSSSRPSPKTTAIDWILNDLVQIDAAAAEAKLRSNNNQILGPPEKEKVVMAFKCGNDKTYLTTHRVLFRPKGWFIDRSHRYESIPYTSILAYGTQTAGMWPDMDTELWLWTQMPELPYFALEFKKGDSNAEIFQILEFFNSKVLGSTSGSSLLQHKAYYAAAAKWGFVDLWHWLRGNAAEINAEKANELFHEVFPLLQQDETVEMAFKVGRDTTLLTTKRMIRVDVTGITGKSVIYESYPWTNVKAFSTRNAGFFDDNSEITIYTSIPDASQRQFEQRLRGFGEGTADIEPILTLFSKRVLGEKAVPRILPASTVPTVKGPGTSTVEEVLAFLGGDYAKMNAGEAEARLRAVTPVLLDDEHVEVAFQKSKLEKDVVYLTTRRILFADIQQILLMDDNIDYLSVPYGSIHAFAMETAADWDFDSKITFWTGIHPPPPLARDAGENGGEEKKDDEKDENGKNGTNTGASAGTGNKTEDEKTGGPGDAPDLIRVPGKSMISFDLRAGSDLLLIQKFLHAKVSGFAPDKSNVEESDLANAPDEGIESDWSLYGLYSWLDGNAKEFSPEEAERRLQTAGPVLVKGEKVQKAFTTWRDMTLLTNQRVLIVDIQSVWKFKTVVYKTVPYNSIRGFGIRSGGTFDFDAEIMLYTGMPWMPEIKTELQRGTSNIEELQGLLCDRILGAAPSSLLEKGQVAQANPLGDFVDWLAGRAGEIEPAEATKLLKKSPPVLRDGEIVNYAYKVGLDMTLFTNNRILIADMSHWDLWMEKMEYRTIPYKSILGYSVETYGHFFDRDEEIEVYTDMYEFGYFLQRIATGQGDIFNVQKQLSEKALL